MTILRATLGDIDPGYGPNDDLRHRPEPGGRMRDSLFWELMMPEEQLGMQIYLYLTDRGKAGFNVCVWGPESEPLVLDLKSGVVPDEMDLDDFTFEGLTLTQPDLLRTCRVSYRGENVAIEYDFTAIHDPFSFRQNPGGLPSWFAINRMEQTGDVTGFLEVGDRRIEWNGHKGNRDHSWGVRNWGLPHHWKWFVAYTESGRAVNGWIWIAKGEWGFGGYIVRDGVTVPVSHIAHKAEYHPDMRQRRLIADLVDITGTTTHLEIDVFGVVKLPTHDKMGTQIWEGAAAATIDGEPGAAQFETHWPGDYLTHLIDSNEKAGL